jgi:hypothetical protein
MGFGGGAIIGAPAKEYLLKFFYRAPEYLGTPDRLELVTEGGVRFARVAGQLHEVVVVGANEIEQMIVAGPPGVYLTGTGTVGVAQTFFTLGLIYFLVMVAAAFSYRLPAPGWKPSGWRPPDASRREKKMIIAGNVDIDEALKTPQFYRALLQCNRRHRCAWCRQDHDVRDIRHDAAAYSRRCVRRHLRHDDQRLQHARPVLLGECIRLPGSA